MPVSVVSLRPSVLWDRLRSTYWFLPSLLTLACILLALGLVALDASYTEVPGWLGWAYGGGADGARSLLSAVAGSTITVVSVTFSVMVVALTVSSQHFGPRLLSSFMRDTVSQAVLGTFTGTFAYCLMVLRTVQGSDGDRYEVFIPHLAVTGSVVLTLLSVAMLIYYVHHVAMSMQVAAITTRVSEDLERSIDRLYPDEIGDTGTPETPPLPLPDGHVLVHSSKSGYIQDVDGDALVAAARHARTTIWVLAPPGTFVIEGEPLLGAYPPPAEPEALTHQVQQSISFGADRTSRQDVAYAGQQLVEVALHALSPGVNEPFTAVSCIDRLSQGLARLARRQPPSAHRLDEHGQVRVVAPPRTFADLVAELLIPIARHAADEPIVLDHLRGAVARLAHLTCRPADRAALERVYARIPTASTAPESVR
jgi:uncharacterized membrane protein